MDSGFPIGIIDEIVARNAPVSLRQERQDVIALTITPAASGDVLRFRFAGVPRRPGADPGGGYLAANADPPPGALEPAADDPTRFVSYRLERGDIHVEIM